MTIPVQEKETLTAGEVLEAAHPPLAGKHAALRMIDRNSPLIKDLVVELLKIEHELTTKDFKFGVLYCKKGQKTEAEMFGNGWGDSSCTSFERERRMLTPLCILLEHGSDQFNQFLTLLGDKIALQGWDGFKGGLSVNGDTTGSHSVFGKYNGYSVMFHVSTLMPYTTSETQQVAFFLLRVPFLSFSSLFFSSFLSASWRENATLEMTLSPSSSKMNRA